MAEEASNGEHVTTIKLLAERLKVGKRRVKVGQVTFSKRTVEDVLGLDVDLARDDYEITRERVDRPATGAERAVMDGDVIRIPVLEERPVVEKRLFVVEEIVIRPRRRQEVQHLELPVRREELVVDERPEP